MNLNPPLAVLCLCLLPAVACNSRLHRSIQLQVDQFSTSTKLDQTELARGSLLGNPYSDEPLRFGGGTVVILTLTARGENLPQPKENVILLDELLTCKLYVQLPLEPERETLDLATHSFVRMLGRYELPDSALVYPNGEGTLAIDSLTKSWLYGRVDARFRNTAGSLIRLDGPFRASARARPCAWR